MAGLPNGKEDEALVKEDVPHWRAFGIVNLRTEKIVPPTTGRLASDWQA